MRASAGIALALALVALPAAADRSGVVFVDSNGNGVRDPGEAGRAGVAVSNGLGVVRSDAEGRYRLPDGNGFVFVTRPRGFESERWYRESGGDFGLTPDAAADADEFFFVQISDAHVYPDVLDFFRYSSPLPDWLPDGLASWLTLKFLDRGYAPLPESEIVARLRAALPPGRVPDGAPGREVVRLYFEEFARPGSEIGRVVETTRAAFAELRALAPAFVLSTGDLVLESNNGSPEAIERWMLFYERLARETGLRFYDTIGNNEIAGIQNDDFPVDDPRYGKGLWQEHFGPTRYSFDRGGFHFVALDTHFPWPEFWNEKGWTFQDLDPAALAWLDADLEAHQGSVLVVANHEPFASDPSWPIDYEPCSDEGRFAKYGVRYVLAGHIHHNGVAQLDGTTHVTTGALSGLRWVLPPDLHERGYRLFYARDGRLWHAWKRTGEPVVAFVGGDPGELVFVAADRGGPFARVEVTQDGVALPVERWGAYFGRVRAAPGGRVAITATDAAGVPTHAETVVP
jgi:hypothetical protein